MNTEDRLFQISSRPILTRFQKARAGLGLGLGGGMSGLRLRWMGGMVGVVVVWVVVVGEQLVSGQRPESRGHSSRSRLQGHCW